MARPKCNFDSMPAPLVREIDVGLASLCWNKKYTTRANVHREFDQTTAKMVVSD